MCQSVAMHLQYLLFPTVNIMFFVELFKNKQIYNGIIFQCDKSQHLNHAHKIFNQHSILMSSVKINDSQYELPKSCHKIGVIVHSSCDGWTSAFTPIPFGKPISWIIISGNVSETTATLAHYPVEADSDVTVAHKINNSFTLYEAYNTGTLNKGTFIVKCIGYWNSCLNIAKSDRKDLRGAVVKLSMVSLRKEHIVGETIEQYTERGLSRVKVDTVHKYKYYTLLKYIRNMYNMRFSMQRVESWGYIRNGSFDGMVGGMSHGDADVGGAPIFFRADRTPYVQYIAEVWQSRHSFIFRHPKYPGGFYTIYTRPLSDVVWYCTVSLLVIIVLVLWIILKANNGDESTLSLAVLTILGAFCQQGSCIDRHASSVKLVLFTTFVCTLTIYQYYNAIIVSSLLLESPKNIRTLKDLLNSDLKVGVDDVLYNRDYFKRTKDPVAIELYKKKISTGMHQNFFTPIEGMALVKRGGFAFHVDTTIAFPMIKETFNEPEICETSTVQLYPLQKMGVVVRKSSPYKEYFAYGIRKIFEAGLASRVQSVTDTPMAECVHTPNASVFNVNIREFSMPLVALAAGLLAAIGVLACEVIVSRRRGDRHVIDFTH